MKIYKIISYNSSASTDHGLFDFVEAQAKLREISLQANIDKIEIFFYNVKTYQKELNNEE